ncbi:hypothetical protein OQA88_617 [Cercophora sp. LCS_1]
MHRQLVLTTAAAYLAALATAQFFTYPTKGASPVLPHTAVYTTTLVGDARNNPPQDAITTVVVTLIEPRVVRWPFEGWPPEDGTPVTGTAISRFSAAQQARSTWSETAQIVWMLTGNNGLLHNDADETAAAAQDPKAVAVTAVYTDYSDFTTTVAAPWAPRVKSVYSSTVRETVVERVGTGYPATIIRTGYTNIVVTVTGTVIDGPTSTNEAATTSYVWTTTMVQASVRPLARG